MTVARRALLLGICALVGAAAGPSEPGGYRTENYGAQTPATLRGATVLSTAEAHALWQAGGAIFVDVLPRVPRPANLPVDTLWIERPYADIPGSMWLPDTGYGALAAAMQEYFERGLREATAGDQGRALVFYCKPDCWMSWNAARRAIALGYTQVLWFPDGAEGWRQAGWPLEARVPRPRPGP